MSQLPPNDIDAEKVVLGALLSGATLADVQPLSSVTFFRPAHQLIYETIASLTEDGKPFDPVAVVDELRRRKQLSQVNGAPYLHTLIASVPAIANAGYYAQIIREHAERRRLIEHADRLRQAALNPGKDLATLHDLTRVSEPAIRSEAARPARQLILTPASEIEPEPVIWAWEDDSDAGRIPAGSLGLFAGREGTGKSSFLIWMAAKITTGTLPGSFYGKPRAVIYVAVEDSWKYTIVPRLMAAGANRSLVYRAEVQVIEGDTVSLSLPSDNKLLEQAITENSVALIALDPLMSAISDSLDTHVNRQVRQALDPLARLADRTGAVIAGIAHFNKSAGTDASSLVTGSGAFKDVARFIFAFAADPESDTQVISQTKNSLGRSDLPSLAYRIISASVPTAKGAANVGRFVLDGRSDRSVQDILYAQGATGERDEKAGAEDALRKILAPGPMRTKDAEDEAHQVYGISKRTLERARRTLGVPARKRASGPAAKDGSRSFEWWISLPEHEGDLKELYTTPEAETDLPAKTANAANADSPGDVGGLGGLDSSGLDTEGTAA